MTFLSLQENDCSEKVVVHSIKVVSYFLCMITVQLMCTNYL